MSIPMDSWLPRRRITVNEYYRMAEAGLRAPDARVELVEGEIVEMPPIGVPHASVVTQLNHVLQRALGDRAYVRVQLPVRLNEFSEPQPEVAVVKRNDNFYSEQHPTAADALLLIEVSTTTLSYDRRVKVPLYAQNGVPEVWIVDLKNLQLHRFRSPVGGEYQDIASITDPGTLSLFALSDVNVALAGILKHSDDPSG